MKKLNLLFIILVISCMNINAQSVQWSKLFDIHSQTSLGGLATNAVLSNGNCIMPVVEQDILKLYKLDNTGTIIQMLNTNNVTGYISKVVKMNENSFALVYDSTPPSIGVNPTFKIIYFNSNLVITSEQFLNFPFVSSFNGILSFFTANNQLYLTVNAFSLNQYYLLQINPINSLSTIHSSEVLVDKENIGLLSNGTIVIDYYQNHELKCINPQTSQLVWDINYGSADEINLDFIKTISNDGTIYIARLVREWLNGNQFDTIHLNRINSLNGEIVNTYSFNSVNNCTLKFEDIVFVESEEKVYFSYSNCYPNEGYSIVQFSASLSFLNQVFIAAEFDGDNFYEDSLKIKIDSNNNKYVVYRKFKNNVEHGNLCISKLQQDLSLTATVELNILPKNGTELFSDILFYDNEQLLIVGNIPNVAPQINLEEAQYFLSSIDLNGVLSNETYSDISKIQVYPNPTSNIININFDELQVVEIDIFDLVGKHIMKSKSTVIDVSNIAKGMYIAKVIVENDKIFSTKFIKN